MDTLRILLELLYHNFHSIRNFLVIIKQNLFTDNFCHKKTGRLVGPLILIEIRRTVRQQILDTLHYHIHTEFGNGGDWNDFRLRNQLMPFFHAFHQSVLVAQIYLIDKQQDRNLHLANLFDEFHILIRFFHHIGYIEQHISVRQSRFREIQHGLLQFIVWLQHSWSVGEHNLHFIRIQNPHNPVTGSLCLEGSDRDSFANQQIHQSRFTHIGISHNIHKSCLMHINSFGIRQKNAPFSGCVFYNL